MEAGFSGGDITSNGGVLLLRQADRALRLTGRVARALSDPRRLASCRRDTLAIVRQRIYSLALGYEDLNDHEELRRDLALQTAVEKDWADRKQAVRLHEVLVKQFIASHKRPPRRVILDLDATDDRVLLSAFAYVLLNAIRRIGLARAELARAYVGAIRLKLLKIGAAVLRNTRRVRFLLSSAHPRPELFFLAAARLKPG